MRFAGITDMLTRRFTSPATSPGIAIGKAYRYHHAGRLPVTRTWIRDADVTAEIERFKRAVQLSKEKLSRVQSKLCRFNGHEQIDIIESYRLFLQDDMLVQATIEHIADAKINSEWALDKTLAHLRLSFLNVHEEYLRERSQDIDYVGRCIMDYLLGRGEAGLSDVPESGVILITHDLSPAEIASFPRDRARGFVMEVGGETSHSAIIARSLEIPAMFGVKDVMAIINDGEMLILDGIKGVLIASPGEAELKQYETIHKRYVDLEKMLLQDINLPAETKDGMSIRLDANIELVEEIKGILEHGAEGIGLYRTEYLFLDRLDEPSEEEQFDNYVRVLKAMAPRPVTIRTIDLGADKLALSRRFEEQANPALGLRGIRLCLKEINLFKRQLRALLCASPHGSLKILLPMVADLGEVTATKRIIEDIKKALIAQGIPFDTKVPIGIMVETPAAVLMAEAFAREVDFFSIGTNDLIQYCLAIDRANELVNDLYSPFHPAILRMIAHTAEVAKKIGIPVAICGEMAGDPLSIMLLIGMGLDSLSMNPVSLPRVKKILRSLTRRESEALLHKALKLSTAGDVEKLVRKEMGHLLPAQVRQIESFFVKT